MSDATTKDFDDWTALETLEELVFYAIDHALPFSHPDNVDTALKMTAPDARELN